MAIEPPPPANDRNDDTEAWLNAIVGQPASSLDVDARREASALRQALLDLDREEAAAEKLDHDWEQLRFRARREGLLKQGHGRPAVYWALAASLMLSIAVGVMIQRDITTAPESQVVRGKTALSILVRSEDPQAAAARIATACAQSGTNCQRRDDPSGAILFDLALPATIPPPLVNMAKELDIELPPAQTVTLMVMKR